MPSTERTVHGLIIATFVLQMIFCVANSLIDSTGYVTLIIVSIVAHTLYYLRVLRRGETHFKINFFYYEIAFASVQSILLLSNSEDTWPMIFPVMAQAATCFSMYMHIQQSDSDLVKGVSDGEIKKWIVHGLTLIAFPLQLLFFYASSENIIAIVALIIITVVSHALYIHLVIMRRENQYRLPFFYYEIGVAVSQCFSAFSDNNRDLPTLWFGTYYRPSDLWPITLPLMFQVALCTSLYFYTEVAQLDGLPSYLDAINSKKVEELKKAPIEHSEIPIMLKKETV
ncbi:hypothetical protein PENTCL1PPCAC_16110 [Pristionchus entomophagus]|uniref:G protein-coupled receptor n=1 Tax=Pristionchus entomophagus TaxID=358040 RepID=A0AAV5THY1_9BILA|nr:hypothetical protein PENTCL1PPCAC_16110 [Pristionchus entomophagus]